MQPTEQTAVRVLLSSGETRTIDGADSAQLDEVFFLIMRRNRQTDRIEVIVTLRSQDVLGAEILTNGVRTAYVEGKGAIRYAETKNNRETRSDRTPWPHGTDGANG